MKSSKYICHFAVSTFAVLCLSLACKKLIHVDAPDDMLEAGTVFSNDEQATAAVMGLYSVIMGQTKYLFYGGMSLFPGLSADELERTSNINSEDQFTNNTLSPANTVLHNNIWRAAYTYLYQCNIIIERLEGSNSVSQAVKNRLTGEAEFIRALCYYYLINLFGDVPLILSTNADKNAVSERTSVESVYIQIVTDLQDAREKLPDIGENTRPNKMACYALLARVFLYKKNWAGAEQAASVVISSGKSLLVSDLDKVFLFDSQETIFQLAPVLDYFNTAEGYLFVPGSPFSRPNYVVTTSLLHSFEAGDIRETSWLDTIHPTGSGNFYVIPHKYKVNTSASATEYNIVLRLAEQYLIRAEARMQQQNFAGAVEDINVIRTRAGLPNLPETMSNNECKAALEHERRIEFFAEWGHRWIDLKRWQRSDAVLGLVKASNWQSTDELYPIPASEIEKIPSWRQNDGY